MSVMDTGRGGVPYDCGAQFHVNAPGHHLVHFSMPLKLFNDGNFRIIASMRIIPDVTNLSNYEQLAFTSDENACDFVVRNHGTTNFAGLINDRSMEIVRTGMEDMD